MKAKASIEIVTDLVDWVVYDQDLYDSIIHNLKKAFFEKVPKEITIECPDCNGEGYILRIIGSIQLPGLVFEPRWTSVECDTCHGKQEITITLEIEQL